jgi:hypothetical protein
MVTEQELKSKVDFLKKELSSLVDQNKDVELQTQKRLNKLFDRVDGLDSWSTFIQGIDDIPGVRQPKWYKIEVPFEYEENQELSSQVQISASGPFVCTQMQSYYKITDTDPEHYSFYYPGSRNAASLGIRPDPTIARVNTSVGRMIPPTAYYGISAREWSTVAQSFSNPLVMGELFSKFTDGADDYWYEGWSYPELDIRIQTANNNSYWTGLSDIPSAALYGMESPLYLGVPSIVKASDSIVVFAKPSTPKIPIKGTYTLVLHGYHIGLHSELSDLGV